MDGMPLQGPGPIPLNAPQGAPAAMPNPKEGVQARAKVEIQQALQLLKKNLTPDVFMVDGPEWKQLYKSIQSLSKLAGEEQGKDVSQAGLKMIASSLTPKGLPGVMGGGGAPPPPGMTPMGPSPVPLNIGG